MSRAAIVHACLLLGLVTGSAGADDFADTFVPSAPHGVGRMAGLATTLRQARDTFLDGQRTNRIVAKDWLQRVHEVTKTAAAVAQDLGAWRQSLPREAADAVAACLRQQGSLGLADSLKISLEFGGMGCGGSLGPANCYPGWANDAESDARALDAWIACIDVAVVAQQQADAARRDQANRRDEEKRRQDEEHQRKLDAKAQQASGAGAPSGGGSGGSGGGTGSIDPEAARIRAEVERKRQIRDRWERRQEEQRAFFAQQRDDAIERMNQLPSGGNEASGTSWRVHLFTGTAALLLPVFTNRTGADINPHSGESLAGGIGADLSAELWPVFGPHAGVGVVLEGALGFAPGRLAYEGYAGARGYLGKDGTIALLGEVGAGIRSGSASGDVGGGFIDATESGSATYNVVRYGLGGRLCLGTQSSDRRFCKWGMDAMLFVDQPRFTTLGGGTPLVGRFAFWVRGAVMVSTDLSFGYPVAGVPLYPHDDDGRAFFMLMRISKGFDWFGAPYGETDAQRRARKERERADN